MTIDIKTIPHAEQRYPTCGDWWDDEAGTHFRISDLGNPTWEFLIAVHEFIEWFLCKAQGVSQESVDEFDKQWEAVREPGNVDEPGNSPKAPYYEQHRIASVIEHMLAIVLGVDWDEYDKAINAL